MQLSVLGAGTCIPYKGYSAPGYLLQWDNQAIMLDAGPGSVGRMAGFGFDYRKLRYVFLSHLHPDHALDLLTLIQALGATPGWSRKDDLNLIGCRGLKEFLHHQLSHFRDIAPEDFSLPVTEIGLERLQFSGWTVTAAHTGHTPASLAFRIETDQASIVYTGDVADPDGLRELCMHADLLVCECSFPNGHHSEDHLNAFQVGRLAQASSAKRVLLTHLYPPAIEADLVSQVKQQFNGRVEKAMDGVVITL